MSLPIAGPIEPMRRSAGLNQELTMVVDLSFPSQRSVSDRPKGSQSSHSDLATGENLYGGSILYAVRDCPRTNAMKGKVRKVLPAKGLR